MNAKRIAIAAVALAGALGAGLAQARDHNDVQWSVTIGNPSWVRPAPVYTAPVIVHDGRGYDRYHAPTRWDVDGDGIPNRVDRVYNPRWDRDGDGVPNRYDRHDNRRYDGHRRGW